MFAVLAASCQGFVAVRSVTPRTLPLPSLPRAAAPQANLFDSLGKIAEYNKKYWGTMAAGMMDGRTARASHVLFGYAKYEKDGEQRAADLKLALDSGEITFADAAKASPALTRHPALTRRPAPLAPHNSASYGASLPGARHRGVPPRSSRRARARPKAAIWVPSSEERWCPSSTAPSSARRPRSAACHMHGVCMVHVEPLRGRAESPTRQPLTDCSLQHAGSAPSADPSRRSLGTTFCRLSSGQRRARDPGCADGWGGYGAVHVCGRRQLSAAACFLFLAVGGGVAVRHIPS
jgi:hypothetical protein